MTISRSALAAALALAATLSIADDGSARPVEGVAGMKRGGGQWPAGFKMCEATVYATAVHADRDQSQAAAVQKWRAKVIQTTSLGAGFADWNKAANASLQCYEPKSGGAKTCTAAADPCKG